MQNPNYRIIWPIVKLRIERFFIRRKRTKNFSVYLSVNVLIRKYAVNSRRMHTAATCAPVGRTCITCRNRSNPCFRYFFAFSFVWDDYSRFFFNSLNEEPRCDGHRYRTATPSIRPLMVMVIRRDLLPPNKIIRSRNILHRILIA